jgi:predicted secreted protein
MNITARLRSIGLAIAVGGTTVGALAQAVAPPSQGVAGLASSASVEVARDLLQITFSTTREGPDANAVQSQLKQAVDAALAEARKAARPGQLDVQTGAFSIGPRYSPKGGISGWQGTAEVNVEGRDIASISQLAGRITTLTVARAGYALSREAREKAEGEVSGQAIARFRAKAADVARAFGYAGYAIREVTVSGADAPVPAPRPLQMRALGTAAPTEDLPVEAGRTTVAVTVNGTIQMK